LDSSLGERPSPQPEDTGGQQDRASSKTRSRQQKVHSLIDKVFSRKNLERAWHRVKKNHGSAGIDAVTVEQFALRQGYY
jgi:hypothetical protein